MSGCVLPRFRCFRPLFPVFPPPWSIVFPVFPPPVSGVSAPQPPLFFLFLEEEQCLGDVGKVKGRFKWEGPDPYAESYLCYACSSLPCPCTQWNRRASRGFDPFPLFPPPVSGVSAPLAHCVSGVSAPCFRCFRPQLPPFFLCLEEEQCLGDVRKVKGGE